MVGEHKVKALPYAYDSVKGISKQVMEWHHDKHYAGYVNKRNEIEQALQSVDRTAANANYSLYGELKRKETFNASGMLLHELFFDIMGGDGKADESLPVVKKIIQSFGSLDAWKQDFVAAAKSGFGWALTCFDYSDNKIRTFLGDAHNDGAVWGSVPLIPLDVYEHAYYFDQGPNRPAYIEAFLSNLNWKAVNARYEKFVPKEFR